MEEKEKKQFHTIRETNQTLSFLIKFETLKGLDSNTIYIKLYGINVISDKQIFCKKEQLRNILLTKIISLRS